MKLHLGCGQRHLEGYLNIDYPSSEHSVQECSVADQFADIRELKYQSGSIEEVRLHHVFEHFPRPIALALLAGWNTWLSDGGLLRIEVPDFDRNARKALSIWTSQKKSCKSLRHLFGSHEASWAVHWEGWKKNNLVMILERNGFNIESVKMNSWKGIYNIEIYARKKNGVSICDSRNINRKYLAMFMVDESDTEKRLLEIWMNMYSEQFEKTRSL